MARSAFTLTARPTLFILVPAIWGFGLAAAGCGDGTPGVRSADIAASKKAAAGIKAGIPDLGSKRGDVASTRVKKQAAAGNKAGAMTQGKSR